MSSLERADVFCETVFVGKGTFMAHKMLSLSVRCCQFEGAVLVAGVESGGNAAAVEGVAFHDGVTSTERSYSRICNIVSAALCCIDAVRQCRRVQRRACTPTYNTEVASSSVPKKLCCPSSVARRTIQSHSANAVNDIDLDRAIDRIASLGNLTRSPPSARQSALIPPPFRPQLHWCRTGTRAARDASGQRPHSPRRYLAVASTAVAAHPAARRLHARMRPKDPFPPATNPPNALVPPAAPPARPTTTFRKSMRLPPARSPPLTKRRRRSTMPPSIIDEIQALMTPSAPARARAPPTPPPPARARATAETRTMKSFCNFALAYLRGASNTLPDARASEERMRSLIGSAYPRWLARTMSTADVVASLQECVRACAPAAAGVDLAARFHAWARQAAKESAPAGAPAPSQTPSADERVHVTQFCKLSLALLARASKGRPEARTLDASLRARIAALSADWARGRLTKVALMQEVAAAVQRGAPGERKPDVFAEFAVWTGHSACAPTDAGAHARARVAGASAAVSAHAHVPAGMPAASAPAVRPPPAHAPKRPPAPTRERAAILGKFVVFAQQRHLHLTASQPGASLTKESFRDVVRGLWSSWLAGRVSQEDLLRTIGNFIRACAPEAADVDVVREFKNSLAVDALRKRQAREAAAGAVDLAAIPASEIGGPPADGWVGGEVGGIVADEGVTRMGAKRERGAGGKGGEEAANVQYGCIENWE